MWFVLLGLYHHFKVLGLALILNLMQSHLVCLNLMINVIMDSPLQQ